MADIDDAIDMLNATLEECGTGLTLWAKTYFGRGDKRYLCIGDRQCRLLYECTAVNVGRLERDIIENRPTDGEQLMALSDHLVEEMAIVSRAHLRHDKSLTEVSECVNGVVPILDKVRGAMGYIREKGKRESREGKEERE